MLIADARSLFEPQPTGVTEVAAQYISLLQEMDPQIILLKPRASKSNTLTNVALALHLTTIEDLVGAPAGSHILFLPNIHFVHTRPGTRVIQLVHDISFLDAPWWYSARVRAWHLIARARASLMRADVICAVSNFTKQRLIEELHIPAEKIFVVSPATPTPQVPQQPALPFSAHVKFFLALGTQERRKNSSGILAAFHLFQKSSAYQNEQLLFVGRAGFDAPQISEKNVHRLAYCSHAEKWWLLAHARALLYPSFYEGFGLPPLEAGSMRTPSIIADVTAPQDTMGNAALIVSPYDVREMALGIETLARNDKLHAQLAARACVRAAHFTTEKMRASLQKALAAVG